MKLTDAEKDELIAQLQARCRDYEQRDQRHRREIRKLLAAKRSLRGVLLKERSERV